MVSKLTYFSNIPGTSSNDPYSFLYYIWYVRSQKSSFEAPIFGFIHSSYDDFVQLV